jgi:glycosyltransferase involved in cell wall biosynthesis
VNSSQNRYSTSLSKAKRPDVLLISSNSSGRGGGEKYLVYLTAGLRELGCTVHALISTVEYMDGWAIELHDAGAIVHRADLRTLSQRPLRCLQSIMDRAQINRVAQLCKEVAPDGIVVNQQYDEDGLDFVAGALASGCDRVCGVMHMPMTAWKHERLFGRLRGFVLKRWYARHPYRLVLVSAGAQREFENYYPFPRPTYVINNAIDIPAQSSAPERTIWTDDVPVVGFVGQFVRQKNLIFLIDGWLETIRAGWRSRLLLIGDGPLRQDIEQHLWENASPGSWFITGWTERPQQYFKNISLFLLLSHYEGLSLSLLEIGSRGIPALIGEFNGAAEVLARAPWVSQTSGSDLSRFVADLMSFLANRPEWRGASEAQLSAFKDYFSSQRMGLELLNLLNLDDLFRSLAG